jgi:long-chain fatty acid transport protein
MIKETKIKKEEVMKKILPVVLCLLFFGIVSVVVSTTVYATNGMNMEGYGPVATGMGGASMAYDNGTAAVMNNPATLGLMPEGNRLDVALGYLGPNVTTKMTGMPDAESSATAFYMPAIGWVQKSGPMTYGIGMFSQGGMGAEYGADSFLAMGSGDKVRSELGVGRVVIPFAYNVTPDFTIGATIDYVWASLDLKMATSGAQLASMVTNCAGSSCAALPGLAGAAWTRLDFSGGGSMSGAAKGSGYAGKLGATYKFGPDFSMGAVYQSKTSLSDLKTKSDGATLSAAGMGTLGAGEIKVRDFEWPETYAIGVAWKASKELLLVADVKQINWKSVMKSFKMTYSGPVGPGSATIDFAMPQEWKDQTVIEIGAGYLVSPDWTLRIGYNYAKNPIPDKYLNPLFPAIEESHVTLGAGYMIDKASAVDFSFTYAPEVKAGEGGFTVTHSQTNAQIMYSLRF